MTDRIPEAITERRTKLGWTQAELARRAETTEATISFLESGKRRPSVSMLERILGALGLQMDIRPGA